MNSTTENRGVHAYVPGKQVTLAHLIASPSPELCEKAGLEDTGAIGVMTLTPGETSLIAGDIALKAAGVSIAFVDRFSGTLIFHGSVGDVEQALYAVNETLQNVLKYAGCEITKL